MSTDAPAKGGEVWTPKERRIIRQLAAINLAKRGGLLLLVVTTPLWLLPVIVVVGCYHVGPWLRAIPNGLRNEVWDSGRRHPDTGKPVSMIWLFACPSSLPKKPKARFTHPTGGNHGE